MTRNSLFLFNNVFLFWNILSVNFLLSIIGTYIFAIVLVWKYAFYNFLFNDGWNVFLSLSYIFRKCCAISIFFSRQPFYYYNTSLLMCFCWPYYFCIDVIFYPKCIYYKTDYAFILKGWIFFFSTISWNNIFIITTTNAIIIVAYIITANYFYYVSLLFIPCFLCNCKLFLTFLF